MENLNTALGRFCNRVRAGLAGLRVPCLFAALLLACAFGHVAVAQNGPGAPSPSPLPPLPATSILSSSSSSPHYALPRAPLSEATPLGTFVPEGSARVAKKAVGKNPSVPKAANAIQQASPLPPVRPDDRSLSNALPTPGVGQQNQPRPPLTQAEAVQKASAYFNAITTLEADFVQTGGDGHRVTGRLYLSKPGKVLFDYDPPSTLQVIADGFNVAVRDRTLNTQDLYLIAQTPLKFLLAPHVDLARDTRILDVVVGEDIVQILAEDRFTLGGASRIELMFDRADFALRQWIVDDPQGYQTVVTLGTLDMAAVPDPTLFVIHKDAISSGK